MLKTKKIKILPVFIPFLGCPNRCLFCNQNAITGIDKNYKESIISQIEDYLKINENWDEIAFFGGSFTCLKKDLRYFFYDTAHRYNFNNIRVSTRPECFSEEIVEELFQNDVKTVEIGVQSTSSKVLKFNLRNYDKKVIFNTIALLKGNFKICTQLMTGMYKEELQDIFEMITDILHLSPDYARIYPTVVLKNSPLEVLYLNGSFIPDPPSVIIAKTSIVYSYLLCNDIRVFRVGLPESINLKRETSSGFHHPAMGDIVKTTAKMAYILKFNKIPNDMISFKGLINKLYSNLHIVTDKYWLKNLCGEEIEDNWRFFERAADIVSKGLQHQTNHR
jgi:histone acetyltransferase (RNA polymerase elongator complex component)